MAPTIAGHAVRRLTDESTKGHCTPLRRPEPRFGRRGGTAAIVRRSMAESRTGARAAGRRPQLVGARARGRCRWRSAIAACGGRRQPGRGAPRGGDRRADRARVPRRSPPRTRPGSAARTRPRMRPGRRRASIPGRPAARGPRAVTLVDQDDWRAGIAAAALMARAAACAGPADRRRGPAERHLDRARHAQADRRPRRRRRAGDRGRRRRARPDDLRARRISGGDPFALAAAIDAFVDRRRGPPVAERRDRVRGRAAASRCRPPPGRRSRATPCCSPSGTSCPRRPGRRSGDTSGPASTCSGRERVISALGGALAAAPRPRASASQGRTPVENAIAFARYSDATFGWGVRDPGPRPGVREHGPHRWTRPRGASLVGERQVRAAAAARRRRRAAPPARELPARHPARLPVRPGARRLQPRLADWATSRRSASACRRGSTS